MAASPLYDIASARFTRRDVTYSRAWWLVPHSAVSPRDLAQAQAALRQAWIREAAASDFHT